MKRNSKYLNTRKLVFLLLGVLFSMSLSAQTAWIGDQRIVPTSPDSLSLSLVDDITEYILASSIHTNAGGPSSAVYVDGARTYVIVNDLIENISAGDYIEYQIIASSPGQYSLTLPACSKNSDAKVNVSAYKMDSAFVMNGTTSGVYNGQWQSPEDFVFPMNFEAGVVYKIRVSFINAGCNIFTGLNIKQLVGATDASLKDIAIDGVTIPNFSPDVYEYSIVLEPDEWIGDLTAVANDETATVDIPEITMPDTGNDEGVKATAQIQCTSTGKIVNTYTVNIVMPTEVYSTSTLGLETQDVFVTEGINLPGGKMNQIVTGEYVEYIIFSAYDDNMALTIECTNCFNEDSYLNVSTLALDDSTWTLDDRYTQRVPVTYQTADPTVAEWNNTLCTPNLIPFIVQLKEYEPVRLRIYGVTSSPTAADIYSISFETVTESIDNTLSDITVDGNSIIDFDPAVTNYTVPASGGAISVEITATTNDANALVTQGEGTFTISEASKTAEIVVTSEAGYPLTYTVSFVAPIAVVIGDTLALGDDVYYNSGARASNDQINWFQDSMYVDYYIYSAVDANMHVSMLASNGNNDTTYSKVNISTFTYGTEWGSEMGITKDIERGETGEWEEEFADEEEYNISLIANEAVILRVFTFTNSYINAANIFKLTFNDAHTTEGGVDDGAPTPTSIDEISATNISVMTSKESLTVIGDKSMLGASVKIFSLSGRLVIDQVANSTQENYSISQSGLYIVRVVSLANEVTIIKCVVE